MKKLLFFFLFCITSSLQAKKIIFEIRKSIESTKDSPAMINGTHFVFINGIGIPFYQTAISAYSFTSQGQIDSEKLRLGENNIVFSVKIQNNGLAAGSRYYSLFIKTPAENSFKKIMNLVIASGENNNKAAATIQLNLRDIDPELAETRENEKTTREEREKKITLERTQKEYDIAHRRMVEEKNRKTNEILPQPSEEQRFPDSIKVCFKAGTAIHTPEGLKNIEALRPGDQVISFDFLSSRTVVAEVEAINEREIAQTLLIETEGSEPIETTAEHPFWTSEEGGRWLIASDLKPSDSQLFRIDNEWIEVTDVRPTEGPTTVFNLQIKQHHNFYVSKAGYLVHNCDLFSFHKVEIFATEASDILTKLGVGAGAGCAIAGISCVGAAVTPGGQIAAPGACSLASGLCTAAMEAFASSVGAAAMAQWAKMQSNAMHDAEEKTHRGRLKNKLEKNSQAQGDHTTFDRDTNGNIYKYETYKMHQNHKKRFFNPEKRFDGGKPDGAKGAPHINKKGIEIPTPHVQGKSVPEGARKPLQEEFPNNPNLFSAKESQ